MKHTPGPWERVDISTSKHTHKEQLCNMGRAAMQIQWDSSGDNGEGEANARLIAAAPDLLEACQKARQQLLVWSENDAFDNDDCEAYESLVEAIEKATGE